LWGVGIAPLVDKTQCPLRFPGQYADDETGLYYNYFRYYDPARAQYQSSDPVGLLGGAKPWSYVTNPTAWVDPLGLTVCPAAAETGDGAASGGALVKSEWPANIGGFLGDPVKTTLQPGTLVDRYGYPSGSYVSPRGTPFGKRGLPAYYQGTKPYYQYEVVQQVTVRGGITAPAFGGSGGGVQYQFGTTIQELLGSGVLKDRP
jgi:RHS repeat-associated protein